MVKEMFSQVNDLIISLLLQYIIISNTLIPQPKKDYKFSEHLTVSIR